MEDRGYTTMEKVGCLAFMTVLIDLDMHPKIG